MAIDMTQHKCPQPGCLSGTTAHQSKHGIRVCPKHGEIDPALVARWMADRARSGRP